MGFRLPPRPLGGADANNYKSSSWGALDLEQIGEQQEVAISAEDPKVDELEAAEAGVKWQGLTESYINESQSMPEGIPLYRRRAASHTPVDTG